ncbi:uncharacterized protein PAC_02264 [Phialocephala subalpina]|uniref:Uncharacterized protein n=1 Tax=Phialocephala subalpina TaxID=576137 RepID=A0A1L7WI22_9HELO|nr:uncharacterized protein PAC_02264 [Phialocephala subalpina]
MWSSMARLTLARRAVLPRHATRSISRPLTLTQCHYYRVQQTRAFSQTPKPQWFIDPRKIISFGERLGEQPMTQYSPPVRHLLIKVIEGTQRMKKVVEDVERDEQENGMSEEESAESTANAFTLLVMIIILGNITFIQGLRRWLWGGESESEGLDGSLTSPKSDQDGIESDIQGGWDRVRAFSSGAVE